MAIPVPRRAIFHAAFLPRALNDTVIDLRFVCIIYDLWPFVQPQISGVTVGDLVACDFQLQVSKKAVLAVDIGGSKLATSLVGFDGTIIYKEESQWDILNADSVLQAMLNAIWRMMEANMDYKIFVAGVNIPGLADTNKGLWIEACFSGIENVPIGGILSEWLDIPVFIDNDANNCALAEKEFGVCKKSTDFIWVTVSNGCGGALFLENHIYGGIRGSAGEIGHICVEEEGGYKCGCGNYGCLEAQAAGPGIIHCYRDSGGAAAMTAEEVAELARKGDLIAISTYKKEGYYLGKALAAAINTLNPEKVIIGGGVSGAFDFFYTELCNTVNRMVYHKASKHVSIEKTGLGYDAALIGAATLAINSLRISGELK